MLAGIFQNVVIGRMTVPNVRPHSQVRLLAIPQRASPAHLPGALLQRDLEDPREGVARQARELLQDDLLEAGLDGVIALVDVCGPRCAGLELLRLRFFVDGGGDGDAKLPVFAVDDDVDGLV